MRFFGLRLEDVRVAERRVFIAGGKGGHQRLVPVSPPWPDGVSLASWLILPPVLGHRRLERGLIVYAATGALMLLGAAMITECGRCLEDKFDHTAHAQGSGDGDR